MRRLVLSIVVLAAIPSLASASPRHAVPYAAQTIDVQRRLDINSLNLFVTNFGNLGNDFANNNSAGLFFPRGTTKTVLYEAGLWVGAKVGGSSRATIAEYSSEYGPGAMVSGTYEDPSSPAVAVWKVLPWSGNASDTAHVDASAAALALDPTMDPVVHHGWGEYLANAVPRGAPVRLWALPGPGGVGTVYASGPDVTGDQMLWCVFNDADPSRHTNRAGESLPLGIEVQQTMFAYNRGGALANTAFIRWHIVNKGGQVLDSTRAGFWLDSDIGGATDDLVGSDSTASLGYTYNATNTDAEYGTQSPALGADLLGPAGAGSLSYYINGMDPSNSAQTLNLLAGLNVDGTPVIDPTTGQPTMWYAPGDPVAGTGWVDSNPSDRRMLLATRARTLAPGASMDVWAALVVGQDQSRLGSVAQMKCWDNYAETVFDQGFPTVLPVNTVCTISLANCPRTPTYYAQECRGAGHLTLGQLQQLGVNVGGSSRSLASVAQSGAFCALESDVSTPRARAMGELAALIANVHANGIGVIPAGESAIRLDSGWPLTVPGVVGSTIGDMIQPGSTQLGLRCSYEVAGGAHAAPIAGVDGGLTSFGGGAGYAFDFFGSTLDETSMPDSFHTVQLLFDPAHPHGAHRYLRLEQQDTSSPTVGRAYRYAGYFGVPFVARDSLTGDTLDVAFVERAVTDADGSLLAPEFQPATFDSTWLPGNDSSGGREYLMIYARKSRNAPRAELAQDGAFVNGALPWMYALWSKRTSPTAAFGAGDRMTFGRMRDQTLGVDSRLLDLAGLPQSDPAVLAAYADIDNALGPINAGVGLPYLCTNVNAVEGSLVSATAEPGRVDLLWNVTGASGVTVQRLAPEGTWQAQGQPAVGATGSVRWSDTVVEAGGRYGYRLALGTGGSAPFAGETWVTVPRSARLAIAGFTPNPGLGPLAVRFSLPAAGRAQVQVLDLAGRRVFARDVSALGPGTHEVPLGASLAPGVYWLRVSQGGAVATAKGVLLR